MGGTEVEWHENGQKKREKINGLSETEWNEKGLVTYQQLRGKPSQRWEYDENGNVIEHYTEKEKDTRFYLAKIRVAAKRIEEERKLEEQKRNEAKANGTEAKDVRVTLPRKNKFEKAISMAREYIKA